MIVFFLLCIFQNFFAQESKNSVDKRYAIKGYLQTEALYDSYTCYGSSDDFNIWYPLAPDKDPLNKDRNAGGRYNICPIESRVQFDLYGPLVKQLQSQATVEVDIAGRKEILNIIRLRHAYFELYDKQWRLTFGHTWHPFHTKPYAPTVISNNAGNPFEPYGRKPQIRISYKYNMLRLSVAALAELDNVSAGPQGNSSMYSRNSLVPELALVVDCISQEKAGGVGLRFKRLRPRGITDLGYVAAESINSVAAMVYAGVNYETWKLSGRLTYAQNGSDINLLGGYAVHERDLATGEQSYTTIDSISVWLNGIYKGFEKYEMGVYTGYAYNCGARDTLITDKDNFAFGVGTSVKHLYRCAPFISYQEGPFKIAGEIEATCAWHGALESSGNISGTTRSHNIRFLCALFYYF